MTHGTTTRTEAGLTSVTSTCRGQGQAVGRRRRGSGKAAQTLDKENDSLTAHEAITPPFGHSVEHRISDVRNRTVFPIPSSMSRIHQLQAPTLLLHIQDNGLARLSDSDDLTAAATVSRVPNSTPTSRNASAAVGRAGNTGEQRSVRVKVGRRRTRARELGMGSGPCPRRAG
jgi:hypothetical protein